MTESILQIKDLRKSFGDNEILKGISLDVKQGEVVVILGSSGCGKSTLLRCINGLETIQGGDILLDGKSITGSKKDFHLIRQKIGMVFQSYDLFPHLDILQNLILGPVKAQGRNKEEVIAEAEKLLDRVGLRSPKHHILYFFVCIMGSSPHLNSIYFIIGKKYPCSNWAAAWMPGQENSRSSWISGHESMASCTAP